MPDSSDQEAQWTREGVQRRLSLIRKTGCCDVRHGIIHAIIKTIATASADFIRQPAMSTVL